jgi:hypothetical protein
MEHCLTADTLSEAEEIVVQPGDILALAPGAIENPSTSSAQAIYIYGGKFNDDFYEFEPIEPNAENADPPSTATEDGEPPFSTAAQDVASKCGCIVHNDCQHRIYVKFATVIGY